MKIDNRYKHRLAILTYPYYVKEPTERALVSKRQRLRELANQITRTTNKKSQAFAWLVLNESAITACLQ